MKTACLSWGLDWVVVKELSLSYHGFLIIETEQLGRIRLRTCKRHTTGALNNAPCRVEAYLRYLIL